MDTSLVLYPQFKIESQKAEHSLKNEYIKEHAGTKVQLVFNDDDVKISDFEWKSDNTSIATVTKEGLVTVGCYKGATYITGTSKINSEIVKCYVTVDPYKIAYILDEDVISEIQNYQRVYYPGDMEHCKLPDRYYPYTDSVYKAKKELAGWYRTEGTKGQITEYDLCYMNEDICLYPIWEDIDIYLEILPISNVTNVYSIPYEERLELRLSQSELPFDIMSSQEVTTFMKQSVEKYNQENPDHMIEFLYFSDDKEGKNLITEITDEFIELRKSTDANGKDYYWNRKTKYLIPQYREVQNTKAKVLGTQMILRGKLELKYDVVFSDASKDKLDEMIVVFKCDNREERRKLTECGSIVDESMNEYYLSTLVNVTEIDQEIELSFEDRNGNCITIENANDGMSFRMSAFEYLNQFINGQYDIYNQTHQVVTFISIYGLYAQRYFGKANTDDYEAKIKKLIGDESWDSFVDLIDKVSYEDIAEQKYKVIGKSKNVSYYGSSLLLKSGTTIRHYFNVTDANSIKNIKFYCDGVEITPHVYGEMYYVEVEDISPADFHRMFKIEADGIQIQYGVNSYLYSALKSKHTSEKMVSLAKVMYLYGKSCRKY